MLKARYRSYTLRFKETAITSLRKMNDKETFIIQLFDISNHVSVGIGECNYFDGLSQESRSDTMETLERFCQKPDINLIPEISSIRFGVETALKMLESPDHCTIVDTDFTKGLKPITINGLIWMGDKHTMFQRMSEKLDQGCKCIKLKIGGIDFNEELDLLRYLRQNFDSSTVEIRLDANGAFSPENALEYLKLLSEFDIHSIEQPIRQGQWDKMSELCRLSPIPIALDEELIGFNSDEYKQQLLDSIAPQYIILKPALCGGFSEADRWIKYAECRDIGWWATSALESNIGLSAIAQWVAQYNPQIPQGLGTGALYTNNFPSPLTLIGDKMYYNPDNYNIDQDLHC